MKRIYFLRHCEAERHPILGYTLDILSEEGIRHSKELGNRPWKVQRIVSSPNKRTIDTAGPISEKTNLKIVVDPNWGEISRGIFNSLPYSDFLKKWGEYSFDYDFIPEGGESINHGRRRIFFGILDFLEKPEDTLCVTHAGVVANLLMMLYGVNFDTAQLKPGAFCCLYLNGEEISLDPRESDFLGVTEMVSANVSKLERQLK